MDNSTAPVTVRATANAPLEKVWEYWTSPAHVMRWNHASDDWHTPHAENDLRPGGTFRCVMAARDGSFSFEFSGVYSEVTPMTFIASTLGEGRRVTVSFRPGNDSTTIEETFDPEQQNSREQQQAGWQAILNNFVNYVSGAVKP